jgi:hypothetical protein
MKRKHGAEGAEDGADCRSFPSSPLEEHTKKSQKVEDGELDWKLYAEEIEQRLETTSPEQKNGEVEAEKTECQLWAELSHARAKLGQWHEALNAARKAGRSTFEVLQLLHLFLPRLYSFAINQGRRAEAKALLGLGRCGEALTVARDAVGLANDAQEPEADILLRSAMTVRTADVCGMLVPPIPHLPVQCV